MSVVNNIMPVFALIAFATLLGFALEAVKMETHAKRSLARRPTTCRSYWRAAPPADNCKGRATTMSIGLMTPERYRAILSEYDAILAHACAMSDRLVGRTVVERHLSYAETIFTKLLCHAISLRKLSPTPERSSPPELWDIGAACAIARTLIEAFDALAYISLQTILPPERELRILVWELHDQEHRLHMLENIGAAGPGVEEIRTSAKTLHGMVTTHAFYTDLSNDMKGKIAAGKAPAYFRSQKDRNAASGINHDYYISVTTFLSQYVHTLPFALSQLTLTHAGDSGALQVVAMPLQYSMLFIAKTIVGIGSLWPHAQVQISADLLTILDRWLVLAEQGVKGVGR
ncbi:hypothetical protein M0D69_02910 [Caballeronia sp. SEWSISQ10-4 2]|uniref:hypothetical protein n=1 Tax=Caballeronia sp. SEWSISQ10-4 2 TaxID=2937438 RepID=UPI00264BEA88|nr:hypothetical protein [Caballeronia sp. SEWSISQ10-4 2]MDN7176985.1 hypothetical protein [Caballeronia sp. SEWSISQ10-4 2]